jgi:hypothetical protein
MALKTTPKSKPDRVTHVFKTSTTNSIESMTQAGYKWWEVSDKDKDKRASQLCATLAFLKQSQTTRLRQLAIYARLFTGQPLFSFIGSNLSMADQSASLAPNRAVYNAIASIVETLVSRITQNRPSPVFLTDNGDYKQRNLAKKLNSFILGEFYRTKAYEVGEYILTDALGWAGTGVLKVYKTPDRKVGIERKLLSSIFVDMQESAHGDPRRIYETALYDREVLLSMFPGKEDIILKAEKATVDKSSQASKTVSDLVMVVEGFSLPSIEGAGDGLHTIAVSSGELFTEEWKRMSFPYIFLNHTKRTLGFWAMSVAEKQMGSQLELNSMLDTISKSIKLTGVPRVFYEMGSKVNKASFSNKIGILVPYQGTKPTVEVSQCVPQEMYAERDSLIQRMYNSEGASQLAATSQKPEGLDSGEAQRVYQDINAERFAALEKRYSNFYVDLAYQFMENVKEIIEEDGSYNTVFVDRRKGRKEISLDSVELLDDTYVVQCYTESSLPKDPAGRLAQLAEWLQGGIIDIQTYRRMVDFPDIGQMETLANAAEERIYMYLDDIMEKGKYEPPDQFMPIPKCEQIVVQYINLYATCKLEERKMQMLRDWFAEVQVLKQAAMPPPVPQPVPQGAPQPTPTSPLVPNGANPPPQMAA